MRVLTLVALEILPVAQEPEPEVPADLQETLAVVPEAQRVWADTTTIAPLDWKCAKRVRLNQSSNVFPCKMLPHQPHVQREE